MQHLGILPSIRAPWCYYPFGWNFVSGQEREQEEHLLGEGADPGVLSWAQDPEWFLRFIWSCCALKSTVLNLGWVCVPCSYLQCGWPVRSTVLLGSSDFCLMAPSSSKGHSVILELRGLQESLLPSTFIPNGKFVCSVMERHLPRHRFPECKWHSSSVPLRHVSQAEIAVNF